MCWLSIGHTKNMLSHTFTWEVACVFCIYVLKFPSTCLSPSLSTGCRYWCFDMFRTDNISYGVDWPKLGMGWVRLAPSVKRSGLRLESNWFPLCISFTTFSKFYSFSFNFFKSLCFSVMLRLLIFKHIFRVTQRANTWNIFMSTI